MTEILDGTTDLFEVMAQEGEEVDDKKVVKDDSVGPRGVESRELLKQTSNVVK